MKNSKFKLTILLISTNQYKQFVPNLVSSISKFCLKEQNVQIILFTDEIQENLNQNLESRVQIDQVKIDSHKWPFATLLRYKIISSNSIKILGEIVMYMDVDTLIIDDITLSDFEEALSGKEISLVEHPGYFNRNVLIKAIQKIYKKTGWETNRNSLAFVPFRKRRQYVCGGVWFGKQLALLDMIEELSEKVDKDLKSEIVAKFHDESHLNRWLIDNSSRVNVVNPKWAYAPNYKNLKSLNPLIIVLEKDSEFAKSKKIKSNN